MKKATGRAWSKTGKTQGRSRELRARVWELDPHGHYVEPAWVDRALFHAEQFVGPILDPWCGFGTMPDAAIAAGHDAIGTDIVDRGWRGFGGRRDFQKQTAIVANIAGNPPFHILEQAVRHAVKLSRRKTCIVMPTRRINAAHEWLPGLPCSKIYYLTPRPSMPPGHVIAAGESPEGGRNDFLILVFERGYVGAPVPWWLHRELGAIPWVSPSPKISGSRSVRVARR